MNAPYPRPYRSEPTGMTVAAPEVTARFDGLGPGGESFRLVGVVETVVADSVGDVATVLRAAEQAAREGTADLDTVGEIAVLSSLRGMRRARLASVASIGSRTTSAPTTSVSTSSREKPMPHNSCSGTE